MPVGKGNTDTGRGSVQLSHLGVDLRLSGGETSPHLQVANPSDRRLSRKGPFLSFLSGKRDYSYCSVFVSLTQT